MIRKDNPNVRCPRIRPQHTGVRLAAKVEVGSIGIQHEGWVWGIDSVIPMRELDTEGIDKDRKDCMRKFRAAWDRFSADPARLTDFLDMKRKRR